LTMAPIIGALDFLARQRELAAERQCDHDLLALERASRAIAVCPACGRRAVLFALGLCSQCEAQHMATIAPDDWQW
jgi:hypothetical protein